jgi:hypothetical protein
MKLSELQRLLAQAFIDHGDKEVYVLGADGGSRPDIDICLEYDEADNVEGLVLCDSDTSEALIEIEEILDDYDEDLLN